VNKAVSKKGTRKRPATRPEKKPTKRRGKSATMPTRRARGQRRSAVAAELELTYDGALRKRSPATAAQLAVIERRVGAALPADYKAFLTTYNGGAPKRNFLPVGNDGFLIESLHYVDGRKRDIYDVEKASEWPSDLLGEQVIAFASDGSGDQLIFRRVAGDWKIAWWKHDEQPALAPLAHSFEELLAALVPDPFEDESFD
jgi:hypothetical protein